MTGYFKENVQAKYNTSYSFKTFSQNDLSLKFKLRAISELNMKFMQLCKWLKRVRLHTFTCGRQHLPGGGSSLLENFVETSAVYRKVTVSFYSVRCKPFR